MNRYVIAALMAVIVMLLTAACQNNGDIGDLYGTWRVDRYTADGEVVHGYADQTVFSFQSSVICIVHLTDDYGSNDRNYGTWSEDGATLTLNFTHSDDENAPGTGVYRAPEWLGMTSDEPMVMDVSARSGSDMTLTWVSPLGVKNEYKLHKIW